jgi:hypothetical protein
MTSRYPELDDIQSLEETLQRPDVRRSKDDLEALLAVGFVEFGASGKVYNRATVIDRLIRDDGRSDNNLRSTHYALTSVSDDAVLLTYESESTQKDGTKRHVLRSSIWKRNGHWW